MNPAPLYLHWGRIRKTVVIAGVGGARGAIRSVRRGSQCNMEEAIDLLPQFNEDKNLIFMAVFEDK